EDRLREEKAIRDPNSEEGERLSGNPKATRTRLGQTTPGVGRAYALMNATVRDRRSLKALRLISGWYLSVIVKMGNSCGKELNVGCDKFTGPLRIMWNQHGPPAVEGLKIWQEHGFPLNGTFSTQRLEDVRKNMESCSKKRHFCKKKGIKGFELWEQEVRERQARQQRNNDKKGETQPPSYFSVGASGKSTPCLYPSLTMLKHSEVDTDLDCPVPRPPPHAPPPHQPAPVPNTPTRPPAPALTARPPRLQTPGRGTPQPPTLTPSTSPRITLWDQPGTEPSTDHTRSGLPYQPRKNYLCAIPNCQFPATGTAADGAPVCASHTAEAWERQYGLKDIPEGEWNKEPYQGDPEGWYGPKPDGPPRPQLTMGQFPMVECPDPHQPGQVQLVYRPILGTNYGQSARNCRTQVIPGEKLSMTN
ncbi:hypothetical protein COCON_G00034070, partial [Conger conger]